ncbi:hypothetical protein AX14_014448 [Amanita brunnescens Koide BX004]|nr:hypothetical protein AX14_014448 [Amanita brunnescens Koide BX004]
MLPDPSRSYAKIDPCDVPVPVEIVRAMEQGMHEYIPLTVLTTKACKDVLMGLRHIVKVEDGYLEFDARGEDVMSVEDWLDGSARYVSLLAKYLLAGDDESPGGPTAHGIAEAWRWHFAEIIRRIGQPGGFEVLRAYDIRLRLEFILKPNSFRPDMWHEELYRHILTNHLFMRSSKVKSDSESCGSSSVRPHTSASGNTSLHSSNTRSRKPNHRRRKGLRLQRDAKA